MNAPADRAVFHVPPGWPTPPAGWTPTANWRPDPSWPPAPEGWDFWAPAGRSHDHRVELLVLYIATLVAFSWYVDVRTGLLAVFRLPFHHFSDSDALDAAYRSAWQHVDFSTLIAAHALLLLVYVTLARGAGYGGFRVLQLFAPFWNVVVLARILWRWTDIRHWEETAARDLSRTGAPAFVTPGGGPVDVTPIEVTAVDITPGGLG